MADHSPTPGRQRITSPYKWAFTLVMGAALVRLGGYYGFTNWLWLCEFTGIILVVALWRESPYLVSTAALGIIVPQLAWTIAVAGLLLTGRTLVGGIEYVVNPAIPLDVRLLTFYHLLELVLVIVLLRQWGYDRRALRLQLAILETLLMASFLFTPPARNINWVFGPGNNPQGWLPPVAYLLVCLIVYPLIIVLPTHVILAAWCPSPGHDRRS